MRFHLKPIGAALLGLAAAGAISAAPFALSAEPSSPPAKDASRQCFYSSNINNFTTEADRIVYIRVGVNDVYRLDLMTECPELGFRYTVQFTRADRGSSICSPVDLTISYRQNGAQRICPVIDMHKLTPEQIAALPKRLRP
jgi:hypothetical protein